jgi:putative SOS response-associated peptidase YedK
VCGRFTVYGEISDIRMNVGAQVEQLFRPWAPKYNISPSAGPGYEQLIALTDSAGQRVLKLARWWFIPSNWSKPLNQLPTTFNARAEDISKRPLFRGALKHDRCLVPATGWREFTGPQKKKQPYHFHLVDTPIFAFAGLKSTWISPDGEVVDTFGIITTEANDTVKSIHDRMPLVVPRELYDDWLDAEADPVSVLNQLCARSKHLQLDCYPTDPVANDTKYEGHRALDRVEPQAPTNAPKPTPEQRPLFENMPEFLPKLSRRAGK